MHEKTGWNETVPMVLLNSFQSDSGRSVRLPSDRNDRSKWKGPSGTAEFLHEAWGERSLTNGTGIFRSFRLEWKKRNTSEEFRFDYNELYQLTFNQKFRFFVTNGKRPRYSHIRGHVAATVATRKL